MYKKTEWKDHIVEYPERFIISANQDETSTITKAQGQIMQDGTPVNAKNLNKIEQGIFDNAVAIIENEKTVETTYLKKADVISITINDTHNGENVWTKESETSDIYYISYSGIDTKESDKVLVGFTPHASLTTGEDLKACAKFLSSIYKVDTYTGSIKVYRNGKLISNDDKKIKPFTINLVVIRNE